MEFFQVTGWGGFVLKEKLKLIKVVLKDWHVSNTQNLPAKIDSLKNRQAALDNKGEEEDLSEAELSELHGISTDIHSLSRLNTSICWQQSRLNWLRDGDANSKKIHSDLAGRRRHISLSSILVNRVVVEGVNHVRQAIFRLLRITSCQIVLCGLHWVICNFDSFHSWKWVR